MVTIRYYKDPLTGKFTEHKHERVIDFIRSNFFTRDEVLDLRFFDVEVLGQELVDDYLDIDEGIVSVTHDSKLPYGGSLIFIAIAIVTAVATVLLMPSVSIPNQGNQSQQSATNALGSTQNEARIGQRIDDIFGYVAKHMPPLWQVPYRVGVNNEETEVLLCCIGRGRYQTWADRWYDGNTRLIDIPNAQLSKYEPNTWPGNGAPSFQIGSNINEKIGIYRQSNDLNPAELLPPNDLDNSLGAEWSITGTTLTATLLPEGFSMLGSFSVGGSVRLDGFYFFDDPVSVMLYSTSQPSGYTFNCGELFVDLGQVEYEVTGVTETTLTIAVPPDAPIEIVGAWANMSGWVVPKKYARVYGQTGVNFYTTDTTIFTSLWYKDSAKTQPVTVDIAEVTPLAAKPFDGYIGPFNVPADADEIILNFVSANGFYKLVENRENSISANIEVFVEELDSNGSPTGNNTIYPVVYSSNNSVRKSVFQTKRIVLSYEKSRVSARRTTDRDKGDNVSNVDIIEWRDFYSFENVSNLDFGDVTLAHIVIPSNSQSRLVKERKQNVDVMRLVTEYQGNGVFGPAESFATDNFAQILIHMSLDPFIGRQSLDNINADGWLILSQQIEDYFGSANAVRFGYDFDDTQVTYQDSFVQVAQVAMCKPYVQNGVYDLSFERQQNSSSMQITCRNKMPNTEVREDIFERQYDGVEVTWRDEVSGVSETFYVPEDRSATNPDRIDFNGCITREQAYKFAYRVYNRQIYNRYNVTFDVDEFGRNIIPGKRIDSPDGTRFVVRPDATDGYRVFDGEVVEVNGLLVELSEPVVFVDGEDHYVTFTKSNGDNSDPILCTQVDDFTIALSELPAEAIYDGYSMDRTKFVLVSEQLRESIAIIPETIEFKMDDNGAETNTVSAINYDSRYYKNDLDIVR